MPPWSPLRRLHCISAVQPAPAWDSRGLITTTPTPLTPSDMCVPLALASSSPGQELDTHSQHPRALPVSFPPLCLALPDLIHPLVGCQHMPCPVGGQEGQGDWVTVLSENGPQSRAEPAATSTSSPASFPAHKLPEISEMVAEGPRLHHPPLPGRRPFPGASALGGLTGSCSLVGKA